VVVLRVTSEEVVVVAVGEDLGQAQVVQSGEEWVVALKAAMYWYGQTYHNK
jgi:hypothetical protein